MFDQLDIFFGDLTVNRALVFARLPRTADDAGLSLVGQVRGPRCLHAQTLPVTAPLVDLGSGPTLLARAVVPDPCFWSPDLPVIYDVTVNLLLGTQIIASARREIGLRSLGVRGRNLVLEGKRWVLRGVSVSSAAESLPRAWHNAAAVLVAAESSPTLRVGQTSGLIPHLPAGGSATSDADQFTEASQWGALTAIELSSSAEAAVAQLRELAQFPAVAMVVIRGPLPADFKLSQVAPNLLLAQSLCAAQQPIIEPWAQFLWIESADAQQVARATEQAQIPVVAVRRLPAPLPLAEARAACDALQRDLAAAGQFAGYVV